jgi:hypothetical protein
MDLKTGFLALPVLTNSARFDTISLGRLAFGLRLAYVSRFFILHFL